MQELFEKGLETAENLIKSHHHQYQQLVDSLLKKETLEGFEVEEIVWGKTPVKSNEFFA
jgi:cell division protease FtsH